MSKEIFQVNSLDEYFELRAKARELNAHFALLYWDEIGGYACTPEVKEYFHNLVEKDTRNIIWAIADKELWPDDEKDSSSFLSSGTLELGINSDGKGDFYSLENHASGLDSKWGKSWEQFLDESFARLA